MRSVLAAMIFALLAALLPALGQDAPLPVLEGTGATTTPKFSVKDRWEIRWDCPDVVSITVFSSDGTIIAGTSSSSRGSLYQPKGGGYYLQISRIGDQTSKWHVSVVQLGAAPAVGGDSSWADYFPPSTTQPGPASMAPVPSAPVVPASMTNAPAAKPASESMPANLIHAVVVIKGDYGEGTGFLVKTADGPSVVTNNHVIRANPNVKIFTTSGAEIKTLGLKGASDRDLVTFKIQDDHYTYFDLATDITGTVQTGDAVITPGNSEGGEVVLDTKGAVLGIGPEQIEISNPIYHGNSGGPVYHIKSGKVLAVVTMARKVDTSNALDKASFENKDSAIGGEMRYFGLRPDTVPKWEDYDWNRFLSETNFLKNFHEQSRCLDSYLNGAGYEKNHLATTDENGPPTSQFFLRNPRLVKARDNFHKFSTDADNSQRIDATRELVMDLESIAKEDMDTIQNSSNFYAFHQKLAAFEIKYRKALTSEIEKAGDRVGEMGH